jgi:hypothetical protein
VLGDGRRACRGCAAARGADAKVRRYAACATGGSWRRSGASSPASRPAEGDSRFVVTNLAGKPKALY